MENSYFDRKNAAFHWTVVDSIDSVDSSNREFLFWFGKMLCSGIGLWFLIIEILAWLPRVSCSTPLSVGVFAFRSLYSFHPNSALFGGALGVKLVRM